MLNNQILFDDVNKSLVIHSLRSFIEGESFELEYEFSTDTLNTSPELPAFRHNSLKSWLLANFKTLEPSTKILKFEVDGWKIVSNTGGLLLEPTLGGICATLSELDANSDVECYLDELNEERQWLNDKTSFPKDYDFQIKHEFKIRHILTYLTRLVRPRNTVAHHGCVVWMSLGYECLEFLDSRSKHLSLHAQDFASVLTSDRDFVNYNNLALTPIGTFLYDGYMYVFTDFAIVARKNFKTASKTDLEKLAFEVDAIDCWVYHPSLLQSERYVIDDLLTLALSKTHFSGNEVEFRAASWLARYRNRGLLCSFKAFTTFSLKRISTKVKAPSWQQRPQFYFRDVLAAAYDSYFNLTEMTAIWAEINFFNSQLKNKDLNEYSLYE
jgi:hypothetical protein